MAKKQAVKKTRKPKEVLEKMERGAKPPPGLTPAQRKAWEAATSGGGSDSWQPESIGDYITGKLISEQERPSKFGPCRVLELDCGKKDGTKSVWCSSVLEREFVRVGPKKGNTLMIVYQGKVQGKKGRPARLFGLSVV